MGPTGAFLNAKRKSDTSKNKSVGNSRFPEAQALLVSRPHPLVPESIDPKLVPSMKKSVLSLAAVTIGFALFSPAAHAVNFGPASYVQAAANPADLYGGGFSFSSYYLQTFENLPQGQTNNTNINLNSGSTTVSFTQSQLASTFSGGTFNDSVDGDDGVIDGSGSRGNDLFFSNGAAGITFTFSGSLPTHAGIVWTDGPTKFSNATISFEAFDNLGNSLGIVTSTGNMDLNYLGGTAEDRFFGAANASGIKSIKIWHSANNGSDGIEVDHFQYGFASTTQPNRTPDAISTLGALAFCVLGLTAFRRRLA